MPNYASPITVPPSASNASHAEGHLTISDNSSQTKHLLRSDVAQFGVSFGASTMVSGALVAATRPDEWLILGDADKVSSARASIDHGGFTNDLDFTHGRAMIRVQGEQSAKLLEKVCSVDFSDAMTPDGAVVSASVAKTGADLIRQDSGGVRSYFIICDRSYGQYLFEALVDAGKEFGITVTD